MWAHHLNLLASSPCRVKDASSGKFVDDFWESSKKLLADPNFVKILKDFDKDNVPPKIMEALRKEYTSNPDFTPANAAKASSAAEGLCKWVCAMDQYDSVAKVVGPKQAALAVAEADYATVMEALRVGCSPKLTAALKWQLPRRCSTTPGKT
jgi:dynein heavy chain, axonemal